jgi:hypothetical protein
MWPSFGNTGKEIYDAEIFIESSQERERPKGAEQTGEQKLPQWAWSQSLNTFPN